MIKTYAHTDFLPLDDIAQTKQASGLRVSAVIPARNEAATIGRIVRCIGVLRQSGLVDELIVMDSASSDKTAIISAAEGARVVGVGSVCPDLSMPSGKGAALWKSLLVADGDIIVCVDADIDNFDSRFIYGLLGPLLIHDDILLVKAFYQRPLALGSQEYENHGGRVTEILVRPLLSMFYPELAHFFQPLAGEYAFRRAAMEQIPISSGYGVEISMLLEMYARWGTDVFAQVDMDRRRHRNRPVAELGKIAHGVLQALLRRLHDERKMNILASLDTRLTWPDNGEWRRERIIEQQLEPIAARAKGDYHA
jgi:glucosyl-3-phosphoglycerate synthase